MESVLQVFLESSSLALSFNGRRPTLGQENLGRCCKTRKDRKKTREKFDRGLCSLSRLHSSACGVSFSRMVLSYKVEPCFRYKHTATAENVSRRNYRRSLLRSEPNYRVTCSGGRPVSNCGQAKPTARQKRSNRQARASGSLCVC